MTGFLVSILFEFTFLLTRPSRDVTNGRLKNYTNSGISTHTPLAGRDDVGAQLIGGILISTHTPLAGRDRENGNVSPLFSDFYSHAPRGT